MGSHEVEWIKKRVDTLTDGSQEILSIEPTVRNEFSTWSALKLIVHSATVNMYTKVISNHMDDFFYIDALAGSGASDYDKSDQCFLGSPIVAARAATEPFTKMYFIESDEDKKSALERRLDYVFNQSDIEVTPPEDYEVIEKDANIAINNVIDDIWRIVREKEGKPNFNYLLFADNQGLNFHWDSLSTIGDLSGDLLINYPAAQAVGRNISKPDVQDTLSEFFGVDTNNIEPKTVERFAEVYHQRVQGLDRPNSVVTKVKGQKSYYYDMIYATRETSGGSGYTKAIEHVKEFVESVDGSDVEDVLDVLNGDQAAIEDFWPEEGDVEDDLLKEDGRPPEQKGLGDF